MTQWQINEPTQSRYFVVGGHQGFTAANRRPHWCAKRGMQHGGTMFHRASRSDKRRFAVANWRLAQHLHKLLRQRLT